MRTSKGIKGIIYRIYNSSASDKVLNMIDTRGRKVSILAKGVRKPNSKKSYSIDLGNFVQANIVEGYNVPILTEVKLINEFRNWKDTYQKIILLQYLCEIVDKFSFEDNPDYLLYQLFHDILIAKTDKVLFAAAGFSLEVLKVTGNLPQLEQSLSTEDNITQEGIYAIPGQIGYVSEKTNNELSLTTQPISINIYKTQKFILKQGTIKALRINLSPEEIEKMFKMHSEWIEIAIDNKLKSKEIYFKMKNHG